MKIRIINGLLIVDILVILLILAVIFIPSSVMRTILALPFLLFFPGYVLVAALFVGKEEMNGVELVAVSLVMSLAVVALIGFGLNYTIWGIRLEPVLYSVTAFILVMSAIALIRRAGQLKLILEFNLRLPDREGILSNKPLSIILLILILCSVGVLGYAIVASEAGERFSEFYVLGINDKAQDYPAGFIMEEGEVISVSYGDGAYDTAGERGKVTLGIVNHQRQIMTYSVTVKIDEEPVSIYHNNASIDGLLRRIELRHGEKWEQEIEFAPQHVGEDQKVEFLLFTGDDTVPADSLQLWINVK